jgi:hypothetical protein
MYMVHDDGMINVVTISTPILCTVKPQVFGTQFALVSLIDRDDAAAS